MNMFTITFFVKSSKEWLTATYGVTTEKKAKIMARHQYGADNVLFPNSVVVPA